MIGGVCGTCNQRTSGHAVGIHRPNWQIQMCAQLFLAEQGPIYLGWAQLAMLIGVRYPDVMSWCSLILNMSWLSAHAPWYLNQGIFLMIFLYHALLHCKAARHHGLPYQIQHECIFNPLRAKFFRENINIYLHFMSFLHTNKTHAVEIPPQVRQGPAYST